MVDIRTVKMAKVLVNYSLGIRKGDLFLIEGTNLVMPLITEVYREALKNGANPMVNIVPNGIREIFYKNASEEQFSYENPVRLFELEKIDAFLTISGSYNTRQFSNIEPERMRMAQRGRERELKIYFTRTGKKDLRWCGTQFPVEADAQEANMSINEYEDFVFGACRLNCDDPVAEWKKVREEQNKAVEWLNKRNEFLIRAEDTELRLSCKGRKWVNCCGDENFPDGEVFTSPVIESVEGHVRFSFPGIYNDIEIEDIRLEFKEGRVVRAEAKKGQPLLESLIDTDRWSRYVGEFAIGTNYCIDRFTRSMLFDEKIGGTVHLALGKGFEEAGGSSNSIIHWDMLCDMRKGGEIYADGELFYKDGKLLI